MRVAAAAAGVSLILASVSGESAAAPPRPDPWANHDRGIALANAVIVKCLRRDASKPPDGSVRCVRSAYLVCERQHGTMSQHDMNDCSYFSQHAWEARLTATIARFMAAKTSESRLGAETEPTKQLLRKKPAAMDRMESGGLRYAVRAKQRRLDLPVRKSDVPLRPHRRSRHGTRE
jgi:hypothetical protein